MPILVELRIVPIGTCGTSLSRYVAGAVEILRKKGVKHVVGPLCTFIEVGDYGELAEMLREIAEHLKSQGVQRIGFDLHIHVRFDKEQTLEGMVRSLEEKLRKH